MVLQENRLTDANPVTAATAGARLRPCLYGENLSRVEGSLAYPIYRWANQFFVLFLMTKLGGPFTCMRNKKLARLKWYPSNWTKLFRW